MESTPQPSVESPVVASNGPVGQKAEPPKPKSNFILQKKTNNRPKDNEQPANINSASVEGEATGDQPKKKNSRGYFRKRRNAAKEAQANGTEAGKESNGAKKLAYQNSKQLSNKNINSTTAA